MPGMSRPWRALVGAAVLFAAGCGARTGLVDDGPSADADVDPGDADGAFPCSYGRIGELTPIAPNRDSSRAPQLAWGGGRLAAAFVWDHGASNVMACTTGADDGWTCETTEQLGTLESGGGLVAWDGEAFGTCWLESSGGRLSRFQRIAADGRPLWDAPAYLVGAEGPCRDLVWAGDRYLVALASNIDDPENSTAVLSMDTLAAVQDELLVVPDYLGAPAPFALAADGEAVAVAWVDGDGVHLRTLRGPLDSAFTFHAWPSDLLLGLALRGAEAGVLWAVVGDASSRLFLTRADLATGGSWDPVEVAALTDGGFLGADVIAVAEGWLIAYNAVIGDTQRTVLVPARYDDVVGVEVRSDTTLFEGRAFIWTQLGAPALTYDGVDAYVATTVMREADETPEVRVQVLACHR
jgi:hypothetical protein